MQAGRTPIATLAGPALLTSIAAAMVAWTWGTWPDLLIDFGRDLYVAWRIAEGETLYRDFSAAPSDGVGWSARESTGSSC